MVELVNTKHERGEVTGSRLDLGGWNETEHLAHTVAAIALSQPTPMCKRAVVDRLDYYRLSVLHRVKALKVVGPKDRTKRFRQLGIHTMDCTTEAAVSQLTLGLHERRRRVIGPMCCGG